MLPVDVKVGYKFSFRIANPRYYATSTLKKFCTLLEWLDENRATLQDGQIYFHGTGFSVVKNKQTIESIDFKGTKLSYRWIVNSENKIETIYSIYEKV